MREHIERRSMWAGSTECQLDTMFLVDVHDTHTVFKEGRIAYPPALYKCIDEIAVNAVDHFVKTGLVTRIDIQCSDTNEITIRNDGPGIPTEIVKNINGREMHTPQLVFSEFLSGTNLNDSDETERIVGGQNGLGAKITAVFSEWFTVETLDKPAEVLYRQTFRDGLRHIDPPVIKKAPAGKKPYTQITFMLQFDKFKIMEPSKFHETLHKLLEVKAYHIAAYTGIMVTFCGKKIRIKQFVDFCQMFTDRSLLSFSIADEQKRYPWDICIGESNGKEQQVSIVNGIFINAGGNHIKHLQTHIINSLKPQIDRAVKKLGSSFNKNMLLNNLFIFMRGAIPNPTFASQTKDTITNPIKLFATYQFTEQQLKKIWKFIEPMLKEQAIKKQLGSEKTRVTRGRIDVPKYQEADNCRNAKKRHGCGLIICEGESAVGTARKGLTSDKTGNEFSTENWGIFSIQGVMVNALKNSIIDSVNSSRDHEKRIPSRKVIENERICSLVKVLGLDYNKTYDFTEQGEKDWKMLRYGFIAGLTDQDLDGFNIFGLLATFFMTFWPNLVRRNFIRRIITPLMRAYPKNKKNVVEEFYTEDEARRWMKKIGDAVRTYTIHYYKGLGTHKGPPYQEITNMFKDISDKLQTYVLDEHAIETMGIYYGEETSKRKIALSTPVINAPEENMLDISTQFSVDVKSYQRDNIIRKLLSAIDGFVVSRRKVFFTAQKACRKDPIKVQGLAGKCVAMADYHHGEASLEQTIVRMAQAYPEARNLPLLQPLGNFGSREKGYKDYAASRYIYTKLNHRLTDVLFPASDEYILPYTVEDGVRYEPKYYCPIIPYVLCETNEIPGTGWSMNVHARDIDAIFDNLRKLIRGEIKQCGKLPYWKKDYHGEIIRYKNCKYFVGQYKFYPKENKLHITALTPNKCSHTYIHGNDKSVKPSGIKNKEWVEDYRDSTNEDGVNIVLQLKPGVVKTLGAAESKWGNEKFDWIEEYFELKEPMYDRINLIDEEGKVVEYATYEDVFMHWFKFRKDLYTVRVQREKILIELRIKLLRNMQRFNENHDTYQITNRTTEEQFISILEKNKYDIFNHTLLDAPKYMSVDDLLVNITQEEYGASYAYLLNMNYRTLAQESYTKRAEKIDELLARQKYLNREKDFFTGAHIWLDELDQLEQVIRHGIESKWFFGEAEYTFREKKKD